MHFIKKYFMNIHFRLELEASDDQNKLSVGTKPQHFPEQLNFHIKSTISLLLHSEANS